MTVFLRPFLELTVIIPGLLLAYLPLNAFLKHSFARLLCWVIPVFLGLSILGGLLCRLSAMAENGDLGQIREYLFQAESRVPSLDMKFCENRAADSVIGYYCALAKRENIPFQAQANLPLKLPIDEIDMCLVLSNLLENALEASLKTASDKRQINVKASLHTDHLILIQVENAYDGEVREKNGVFQSSKRKGNGVGIQSVRRISEKSGGANAFTYENGIFTAKIMLHG